MAASGVNVHHPRYRTIPTSVKYVVDATPAGKQFCKRRSIDWARERVWPDANESGPLHCIIITYTIRNRGGVKSFSEKKLFFPFSIWISSGQRNKSLKCSHRGVYLVQKTRTVENIVLLTRSRYIRGKSPAAIYVAFSDKRWPDNNGIIKKLRTGHSRGKAN